MTEVKSNEMPPSSAIATVSEGRASLLEAEPSDGCIKIRRCYAVITEHRAGVSHKAYGIQFLEPY